MRILHASRLVLSIVSIGIFAAGCADVESGDEDIMDREAAASEADSALAPSGSWTLTGPTSVPHAGPSAVTMTNGKVFIMGNSPNFAPSKVAETYDPASGAWSLAAPSPHDHYLGVIAPLSNGKVLTIGGASAYGDPATNEVYNPITNTWASAGGAFAPTVNHNNGGRAVTLQNGKVLVAGGGDGYVLPNYTELYDPASSTWTRTGNMINYRDYFGMAVLPDGKVLAAGGFTVFTFGPGVNKAELYNPATGQWTATGNLHSPFYEAVATTLPNGKVLLAGGTAAELYDPASGTWSVTGSMHSSFYRPSAVLLASGKVLLTGSGKKTEIYDPATGAWTVANDLNVARNRANMSRLANGQVLVSGGSTVSELYTP